MLNFLQILNRLTGHCRLHAMLSHGLQRACLSGMKMMYLRIVTIVGLALAVLAGILALITSSPPSQTLASERTLSRIALRQPPSQLARCDQQPANPPDSSTYNLDEDAADWGVYCEGSPTWIITDVAIPSLDGRSLRCSITGGLTAYSNVHCYRNLLPGPLASVFTLTMPFWFSPTTTCNNQGTPSVIQALEFTMNKYHQSKRYEFALQWQNVGEGAPRWRYWDPNQSEPWVPISPAIGQCLESGKWHTLTLAGSILNEEVHYQRFTIDTDTHGLNLTAAPTITLAPDGLAIAIQLDGNATQSPYNVYIDGVSFIRALTTLVYLPVMTK